VARNLPGNIHAVSFVRADASATEERAKEKRDDNVIKVDSNLVSLDVIVKDKKGKAVTDLKPEDFTISENGVPQRIQFFDSTLTGGQKAGQPTNATDRLGESAGRESQRGVAPESKPRNTYGLPRNIISLVMDGQSTDLSNLKHVRDGIVKYIRERITDSDSVAVFSISGDLQLWQPFTQDKQNYSLLSTKLTQVRLFQKRQRDVTSRKI